MLAAQTRALDDGIPPWNLANPVAFHSFAARSWRTPAALPLFPLPSQHSSSSSSSRTKHKLLGGWTKQEAPSTLEAIASHLLFLLYKFLFILLTKVLATACLVQLVPIKLGTLCDAIAARFLGVPVLALPCFLCQLPNKSGCCLYFFLRKKESWSRYLLSCVSTCTTHLSLRPSPHINGVS